MAWRILTGSMQDAVGAFATRNLEARVGGLLVLRRVGLAGLFEQLPHLVAQLRSADVVRRAVEVVLAGLAWRMQRGLAMVGLDGAQRQLATHVRG
eukprot:scaffold84836_cov63-Phaeocystis_antarctica.AAC.1